MNNYNFLYDGNELFAFGDNKYGQLGLGENLECAHVSRNKPTLLMRDPTICKIVCGGYHTFIIKTNGELFAFGKNHSGQLGLGDGINRNKSTLLMKDPSIRKIVCGVDHTFILKSSLDPPCNGQYDVFAFGANYWGQLGLGDGIIRNKPTLLMRDPTIRKIVCGMDHTFILKTKGEDLNHKCSSLGLPCNGQGELFAFGCNYNGQLGLGDRTNINKPTLLMHDQSIRKIVCGGNHTFILKTNGELYAFGCNIFGQLGLGDNKSREKPTLLMRDPTIRKNRLWVCSYIYTQNKWRRPASKWTKRIICFWLE